MGRNIKQLMCGLYKVYKVVAEFLCQNEDNECIAEALNIIKSWNPTWKPKYFMVDYSKAEINAIESEFPDVAVYLSDFHREQAWQRWVKAGKNGLTVGEQKMFLELMQAIARARSETSYKKAVESLRKSTLYLGNPKVQEYCGKVGWTVAIVGLMHFVFNRLSTS